MSALLFLPAINRTHPPSPQLIGTTVSLALFTRAALAFLPLLFTLRSKSAQNKLDVMRFGSEGWKSVVKLLLGGLAQAIGHFFYEKNKPATFKHPFYSLLGDLQLWKEIVTLQRQL
ncbi:hypothetical protein JCM8547_002461 [Rhodosporidiobolus lusitaniae]